MKVKEKKKEFNTCVESRLGLIGRLLKATAVTNNFIKSLLLLLKLFLKRNH